MTDEIMKRIDALAAKMGVTGSHLWGVLIRQARIEGIEWLCWAALWISIASAGAYLAYRCHNSPDDNWDDPVPIGFCILASAICFLIGLGCIGGTPALFLNPEYWALQQILKAVGK